MMVTRNKVMKPASMEPLDQFLNSIGRRGVNSLLAPAHYNSETGRTSIAFRLAIQKSGLVVRNAWEHGRGRRRRDRAGAR